MIVSYELALKNDSLLDGVNAFRNIDKSIFKRCYILKKRTLLSNCIDKIEEKDLESLLKINFISIIKFNEINIEMIVKQFLKEYKLIDKKVFSTI